VVITPLTTSRDSVAFATWKKKKKKNSAFFFFFSVARFLRPMGRSFELVLVDLTAQRLETARRLRSAGQPDSRNWWRVVAAPQLRQTRRWRQGFDASVGRCLIHRWMAIWQNDPARTSPALPGALGSGLTT